MAVLSTDTFRLNCIILLVAPEKKIKNDFLYNDIHQILIKIIFNNIYQHTVNYAFDHKLNA